MERTKMTARIAADQRQVAAQRRAAQIRQAPVRALMRAPVRTPRIRVKTIEGRIRNRTFKIKKLLAQPKAIEVKKSDRVVRRMTVRKSKIYPAETRTHHY